jgi:opacity protein-like surface antigen
MTGTATLAWRSIRARRGAFLATFSSIVLATALIGAFATLIETVGSATLNATYRLPMTNSPMSPYLISGLGAYRTECSLAVGCEAATKFGWNVGLGTKLFVGFRSFVEARYHRTKRGDGNVHYFPLTLGVMF